MNNRIKLTHLRTRRTELLAQVAEIDVEMRKVRKELEPYKMQAHEFWDEASESVTSWDTPKTRRVKERSNQRPMLMLQAFNLGVADDPTTALRAAKAWIQPCFIRYFSLADRFVTGDEKDAPRIDEILGLENATDPNAMPSGIKDFQKWRLEQHLAIELAILLTCFRTRDDKRFGHPEACEYLAEMSLCIVDKDNRPIMGPWEKSTIQNRVKAKYAKSKYADLLIDMSRTDIKKHVNQMEISEETKMELNSCVFVPVSA